MRKSRLLDPSLSPSSSPWGCVFWSTLLLASLPLWAQKEPKAPAPPPTPDEQIAKLKTALAEDEKRDLKKLLEIPGILGLIGSNGRTPIFMLAEIKAPEVMVLIDLVLAAPQDLDFRDPEGKNTLIVAVEHDNPLIIEKLLARGAKPDQVDKSGRTALSHAAFSGRFDCVAKLVAGKADPNLRDQNGATPLLYAATGGFHPIAALLLENGADPNLKAKNGSTALALAEKKNHKLVVRLLKRHGATG